MPIPSTAPRTLYDKVWDDHIVTEANGETLLYIDRHLVHEVTSPQAFEGLRNASRPVRRPDCTLVTVDHNIPTSTRDPKRSMSSQIFQADSRAQIEALEDNVKEFGLTYFGFGDRRQGIVHVIGPEQGFTLPGTTVVCGDSHTSTHGAFGALAFGIGTSEVEHVLATQTLPQRKSKNMRIAVEGTLAPGVTSKDIILHVIGIVGTAGGTGTVMEFCGSAIRTLSMEARMSICNMSIEAGARAGMIAPDQTTLDYLRGRPLGPKAGSEWDTAEAYWRTLHADEGAVYDLNVDIKAEDIVPTLTWGTSPEDVIQITGSVPDPAQVADPIKRAGMERALEYMGLAPNVPINTVAIDKAFLGSCTNSRIEDLRAAAAVILSLPAGSKVPPTVYAMVVPGSGLIKEQAEAEGLDVVFKGAGWDWREAGCSMCLGMNPDQLKPQERCASTSNRNFEGRQGAGGRTHLMSPAMVAAAAMTGVFTDVRAITSKASPRAGNVKITHSLDFLTDVPTAPPKAAGAAAAPAAPLSDAAAAEGAVDIADVPATPVAPSGMPKFTVLKGIAAPLSIPNVDTDMLIPKQFLKTLKRTGLGSALFYGRRFLADGQENPEFILNQGVFRQSKIIVSTGANFGCGSSREHAPWALNDFGVRCIIAPSAGDIFFNNCFKNGMLVIVLPEADCQTLFDDATTEAELEVDLESQVVRRPNGQTIAFDVDQFRRHCLLNGLDDIGLTLQKADAIASFEQSRSTTWPWLDGLGYVVVGQKNVVPLAVGGGAPAGAGRGIDKKATDW